MPELIFSLAVAVASLCSVGNPEKLSEKEKLCIDKISPCFTRKSTIKKAVKCVNKGKR